MGPVEPVAQTGTRLVLLVGFGGLLALMAVGGFDAIQGGIVGPARFVIDPRAIETTDRPVGSCSRIRAQGRQGQRSGGAGG